MAEPTVSSREWTFGGKTYLQSELTIDGETQLLGLIARTVKTLAENDFPFQEIPEVSDDQGNLNFAVIADLLGQVALYIPSTATDATMVLLGVFPTDEHGKRDPEYDELRKVVRKELKMADFIDMVQTFIAQNDYERLIRPFVGALTTEMSGMLNPQSPNEKPSSGGTPPSTTS